MMGLKGFTCKEIASAWEYAHEHSATTKFNEWYTKLVKLARHDKTKLLAIVHAACDEADQVQFEETLPYREAMKTGRADSVRVR